MKIDKKGTIIHNLKSLWKLLSVNEKKKSFVFLILILSQVFLETLSIGSLYPLFISLFSSENRLNQETWFNNELLENFLASESVFLSLSILIIIIFLLKNIFLVFVVHWTQTFEREFKLRLKKKLLNVYLLKDYLFHISRETGKLVRNVNTATDTIMKSLAIAMVFFTDLFMLVGLVILMCFINIYFVFTSLIIVISISILYFYFFKKILITYGEFTFEFQGEALKRLLQTFTMIKEIKIFKKENYFINLFYKEESKFQIFQRRAYIIRSYLKPFFEILFVVGLLIFFNYKSLGSKQITDTLPELAIFTVVLLRLIPSISKIITSLQKQNQYHATIEAVRDDLAINEKNLISKDYKKIDIDDFKYIELKNVFFKYPDKENYILKNFSMKINKGEYIGIIGESGSGKSTLVDIIIGLLSVNKGDIYFNDTKINVDNPDWKSLFSYVPQTVNIFNDTFLSNITLEMDEGEIDKKKLDDAIQHSGLKTFFSKLNNDFQANLGEIGAKISGGERQRVSIARALYKNTNIIIFDEAFSSLDVTTKNTILKEIEELSKIKTIISISHSLDDLSNCDKIINLNDLKI